MDLLLSDNSVLITGASQGIGEALAMAFADEGCKLILVARSQEKLDRLGQLISDTRSVEVVTTAIDLTQEGSADALVARHGDIDILVNNAGNIPAGDLWSVDEARWRAGWELKVMGYINLTRAFYQRMRERGQGVILNNIGSGGESYDFDYIAGTTGNAALMAFTRALGGRSLEHGIRVLGVNPGPVGTTRIVNMFRERARQLYGNEDEYPRLLENLPLGRAATPQEVADLFVFLASPRSAYTSGTIMTVDGGMSSKKSIS